MEKSNFCCSRYFFFFFLFLKFFDLTSLFILLAGSVVDFTVESYALVGSIIYSLRLRKVPGLTAEGFFFFKFFYFFVLCFFVFCFFCFLFFFVFCFLFSPFPFPPPHSSFLVQRREQDRWCCYFLSHLVFIICSIWHCLFYISYKILVLLLISCF